MPTSILEQIADKIKTRIAGVTTANGYTISVAACVRPNRSGGVSQDSYYVWLEQGESPRNEENSLNGNPACTAYDQQFTITGFINQSKDDTGATDTLLNEFSAQIRKGICTPAGWEHWDNLAVNTVIGDMDFTNQADGGPSQFKFTLTVTYRTKDNDPYTQV